MTDRRVALSAATARLAAGYGTVPVAGRLVGRTLVDASASIDLASNPDNCNDGDIVAGLLSASCGGFVLDHAIVMTARTSAPSDADAQLSARWPVLQKRAELVDATRRFFKQRGFLELDTPTRVICPGLEPHLHPLPADGDRWLPTSPELFLKRALAAGAERVFELARAFRGQEQGPSHLTEFSMLEWYRAFEPLQAIADDAVGLVRELARVLRTDLVVRGCDLEREEETLTVRDAFLRHADIDLARHRSRDELAKAVTAIGLSVDGADDWDDLFFKILLERIEPHLGRERMTVLTEYPASQAALARIREDDEWPVALRFELYVAGVELANAFDELTDAQEQRRRHEADRALRKKLSREAPDLDEAFLQALEAGHPPAAGIALGLDRLMALLLDQDDLRNVVAFPDDVE